MQSRARNSWLAVLLLASTAASTGLGACFDSHASPAAPSERATKGPVADQPLAAFRLDLLQLAFDAVSAMPLDPHLKNRSRAQEEVVRACFELDQPRRALSYAGNIEDWRRGVAYADFAFYCAERGDTADVQRYLDLALEQATSANDSGEQSWRVERIRARIARTHLELGQAELAAKFGADLPASETGSLEAAAAQRIEAEDVDARLRAVEAIVAIGDFDAMRNALGACVQLFDRFFADAGMRERIEARIVGSWHKLPLLVRIELLEQLASVALEHQDPPKALQLADAASAILGSAPWIPEDQIAIRARLAGLRLRAGDRVSARSEADQALAQYEQQVSRIVNIYRAKALRSVAELYHALGDRERARAVYAQAIEAGVENPNSRPRAEDLGATCLSMARHGFEPDQGLRARLLEIRSALAQPW